MQGSPCPVRSLDQLFLWTQTQQVRVTVWWRRPGLRQEWTLSLPARRPLPWAHTVFSRPHPVAPPASSEQDPPPRSGTDKRYRWRETACMQSAWIPSQTHKSAFGCIKLTIAKCKWTLIYYHYHIIIHILSSITHLLPNTQGVVVVVSCW